MTFLQEKDGKPYQVRHAFTCKAQADEFEELLRTMANKPQDYFTPSGRMTTNAVEGFHGLALMYRGKQTALEHIHYMCKTDMAVFHKVYTYAPVFATAEEILHNVSFFRKVAQCCVS